MNSTLENSGKTILKELLAQCDGPQQLMFKRMYCHTNLEADINAAVDQMDASKIDWAISQVERTVANNALKQAQ